MAPCVVLWARLDSNQRATSYEPAALPLSYRPAKKPDCPRGDDDPAAILIARPSERLSEPRGFPPTAENSTVMIVAAPTRLDYDIHVAVTNVADEFGRWIAASWEPAPDHPLHAAVERIWYFDGVLDHAVERIFPSGTAELIVQFDEPHRPEFDARPYPAVVLTGLATRAFAVRAPRRRCRVLGLRMLPAGAYAMLGCPLADTTDLSTGVADLIGRAARELEGRLHDLGTAEARVRATAAWMHERVRASRPLDPLVAWSAERIRRAHGDLAIAALRDATAMPEKRFVARFREQIGVAPKQYARILRFRHALARMDAGETRLGEIAAAAGYYDQAHMNVDFRAFANGLAPSAFLRSSRYPGGGHVAEEPR